MISKDKLQIGGKWQKANLPFLEVLIDNRKKQKQNIRKNYQSNSTVKELKIGTVHRKGNKTFWTQENIPNLTYKKKNAK